MADAFEQARVDGLAGAKRLASMLNEADRSDDPDLADLAVRLFNGAGPALWTNLDHVARRWWWQNSDVASAAQDRLAHGEPSTLTLVVASLHRSGYVRQAAVAQLMNVDDEVALPALALRAGDWVPEVRDQARTALARRLTASVAVLINVGPIAVMLADRMEGRWLLERVEQAVKGLDHPDLRRRLTAQDWRLRRTAYSVARQDGRLTRDELMDAAEHDGDLVIRLSCADAAIRAAVAAGTVADLRPLLLSGTAAVRAAAVSALAAGHLGLSAAPAVLQ